MKIFRWLKPSSPKLPVKKFRIKPKAKRMKKVWRKVSGNG